MSRKLTAVAVILAAFACAIGCTNNEQAGESRKAPDFTLQDLSNQKVRLSDFKGRVVMLEFWATWCPPCRSAIPTLEKLHKTYESRGLKVLAVSVDEGGWDNVRSFARERGISYTVLRGIDDVYSNYTIRLIPAMFLLDKQGVIQKRYVGEMDEDRIEKDVQALL